jgi:enoyl-CoA hydratase
VAETPHASVVEEDGIVTVTFDRQDKRNAIDAEMLEALWRATDLLADRDDLRCLIITGEGPYFTAGTDLGRPIGTRPGNAETEHLHPGWNFRRNYRTLHLLYDEWETIEKPIVVAAQGHCLGAGLEMAASSDFRFCTPGAEFALPEVHLGMIPGSGGTSRLTRIVGPSWGKWLAMAGMRVNSQRALEMGLVQAVFPEDTFMAEVKEFCRGMFSIPAEVLGVAKLAIDVYAGMQDRTSQRHIDRLLVSGLMAGPDWKERSARFAKPKPASESESE